MKTWTVLAACITLSSCSKKEVTPAVELFSNTSMESGSTLPANWWSVNNYYPHTVMTWTDSIANSGKHCLEINNTNTFAPIAYWGQSITSKIPFGKTITLTAHVKSANLSGDGASVALACLNATSNTNAQQFSTTQGTHAIVGNTDWSTYTVSITNVHSDITEIRTYLILLSGAKGKVFFDDVTLTTQ